MTVGGDRGITDPINLPLLHVLAKIESLAANKVRLIDCDDESLEGRYMETRWRHFRQGPPDCG